MAERNPPSWLHNAGDTHPADNMRTTIAALSGPNTSGTSLIPKGGINPHTGNKLQVTQTGSPSMAVLVKSGIAWVPGSESATQGAYGVINDADETVTITTSDPTLPRLDRIVFKIEDSQYSGSVNTSSIVAVAGTPASSPALPAAPANSITMAQVAVAAGATSIVDANITDLRSYLRDISQGPVTVIFTASGSFTKATYLWASRYEGRMVGGGGSGGGAAATSASENSEGGGGGGGEYVEFSGNIADLAASTTVTIGAGGTAASAGATGNTGGTTSWVAATGTITAIGGSGGAAGTATTTSATVAGGGGGSGGSGTADLRIEGGAGGGGRVRGGVVIKLAYGGSSVLSGQTSSNTLSSNGAAGQLYGGASTGASNNVSQSARGSTAGAAGILILKVY